MKSAVLAGLRTQETEESWTQKLDEAALLCEACGIEVKTRLTQKAQKGHPRTLLGSGKVNEKADGVVFVNELTGIQTRNLEQETGFPVIDRSALILEIFERRARTRQAHLQVEAARLAYQLPRLIEGQIHADQQQGATAELEKRGWNVRAGRLKNRSGISAWSWISSSFSKPSRAIGAVRAACRGCA